MNHVSRVWLALMLLVVAVRTGGAAVALEVDLTQQRAFLLEGGVMVYSSPISSGKPSYPTAIGDFKILEKELNHFSSLYGRIVSSGGRLLRGDATGFDPLPRGGRFVPAPMRYFLRFDGDCGLHAGTLPGYPASHGCVRLPKAAAKLFFERLSVGDSIRISGEAPRAVAATRP
ncbi:MAG: hypothetical protein QOC70_2515 [Verrucomicrobiota bacterium]